MHSSRTADAYKKLLRDRREAEGPRETAHGTLGRGSMAGSCSRKLGFEMLGDVAETEPIADNTLVAFHTGTHLHELLQEAMIEEWGMQVEVECDLRPLGYDISGHADGVYAHGDHTDPTWKICWELKTKTAFGFNLARKSFEPEVHEVAQASMYAWALNADAVHLVYLAKDSQYGRNPVRAGETVEWVLPMDEPVPGDGRTPKQIAGAEATRIDAIATEIRSGFIPERFIPGVGEVNTVPSPDSRDGHWRCRFCNFNSLCSTLPTGQTPLESAIILRRK